MFDHASSEPRTLSNSTPAGPHDSRTGFRPTAP